LEENEEEPEENPEETPSVTDVEESNKEQDLGNDYYKVRQDYQETRHVCGGNQDQSERLQGRSYS
jgi:hypothetical protein